MFLKGKERAQEGLSRAASSSAVPVVCDTRTHLRDDARPSSQAPHSVYEMDDLGAGRHHSSSDATATAAGAPQTPQTQRHLSMIPTWILVVVGLCLLAPAVVIPLPGLVEQWSTTNTATLFVLVGAAVPSVFLIYTATVRGSSALNSVSYAAVAANLVFFFERLSLMIASYWVEVPHKVEVLVVPVLWALLCFTGVFGVACWGLSLLGVTRERALWGIRDPFLRSFSRTAPEGYTHLPSAPPADISNERHRPRPVTPTDASPLSQLVDVVNSGTEAASTAAAFLCSSSSTSASTSPPPMYSPFNPAELTGVLPLSCRLCPHLPSPSPPPPPSYSVSQHTPNTP